MALTESQIRSAKPGEKRYRMTDGGGLVLNITPAGKKVWRYRAHINGKDTVLTIGHYPDLTLLDARARALELRRTADPKLTAQREAEKKRIVPEETFEAVAKAYMKREKPHWVNGHYTRFRNRMVNDVFPVIGTMRPRDMMPLDVTRAIAGIEGRGAQDTAVRVAGMIGQVMRYAVAKGFADRDVTADLKGGLDRPPPTKHMPAVTHRVELGRMLVDIWDWPGESYGKPLLQLAAYLFQRPGEIQAMRWTDVDLDNAVWTYRVTKVDIDHAVPLPDQAVAILRNLYRYTGNYPFVFFSTGSKSGHVSPQIAVKMLDKIGWRDQQTTHGFRAVARTVIAEDLKVEPKIIEHQLSHTAVGTTLGKAYNRATFLDERTDMMQRYADHLDALREAC